MNAKEIAKKNQNMVQQMMRAEEVANRIKEKTEFQDLTLTRIKGNKYYFTAKLGNEEIKLRGVGNGKRKHLEMDQETGWNMIRWI